MNNNNSYMPYCPRSSERRRNLWRWVIAVGLSVLIYAVVALMVLAEPPTTRPALAVYRQPAADAHKWVVDRGVTIGFGYESNGGTVSSTQWETAYTSLGAKVIREPSGNDAADAADVNLMGVLFCPMYQGQEQDEPDNLAVRVRDSGGDPEAVVYAPADAFYAKWHNLKPVWINVGLEQLRWRLPNGQPKVDYARLAKACTYFSVDYYPVQRGLPLSDYTMLIDKLAALAPGKVKLGFIESSHQHLNPTYYPKCRAPTPDEWTAEVRGLTDRGMTPGLFPQQIGEDGKGFLYDAMPADLVAALRTWASPAAAGPLEGRRVTVDGWTYKLVTVGSN